LKISYWKSLNIFTQMNKSEQVLFQPDKLCSVSSCPRGWYRQGRGWVEKICIKRPDKAQRASWGRRCHQLLDLNLGTEATRRRSQVYMLCRCCYVLSFPCTRYADTGRSFAESAKIFTNNRNCLSPALLGGLMSVTSQLVTLDSKVTIW